MLNSILAVEMKEMAEEIEKGSKPIDVIRKFLKEHKRVIFGGDGYSNEWEKEAEKRGLPNRKNTVEAIKCLKPYFLVKLTNKLFTKVDLPLPG